MVSKRIKYARAHLSRRRHIAILATPLWRRTQKNDLNISEDPFTVPRKALKARANKRIKMMAKPKFIRKKYESMGSRTLPVRIARIGVDEISKRIVDLSLPKKRILYWAKNYVLNRSSNQNLLNNISRSLQAIRQSRYQKYRVICNTLAQRKAAREAKNRKKLFKVLKKQEDWDKHYENLKKLAMPKKLHKRSRRASKSEPKKLFDPDYLTTLAQPKNRKFQDDRDPFSVKKSALTYNITERMMKLAIVEQRPRYRFRELGRVAPQALHYEASERLKKLAQPKKRKPGVEIDEKENAFSVSPGALKAYCRPRVKILAKPKNRVRKF